VSHVLSAVAVGVGYYVLGVLSGALSHVETDAWTVWLASGLVFGLLLACDKRRWPAILVGAFLGAAVFDWSLSRPVAEGIGYGAIEVVTSVAGAMLADKIGGHPLRLADPQELVALLAGALVLSMIGAFLATAWQYASGGLGALVVFRVWTLGNVLGAVLVAPLIVAWAAFRPRRSGGLPMRTFIGGGIAFVLFAGCLQYLFSANVQARFHGSVGESLTYVPFVFFALVALLWGVRGATLAAATGALLAVFHTVHGRGPFAGTEGFLGEAALEVQAYLFAISLTGLLIATLAAGQRTAAREAREWRTRFEGTIAAHRMLAYEWDPASGRLALTGEALPLLGVAPERLATLADWLGRVAAADRDAVSARFGERGSGGGASDTLAYAMQGADGGVVMVSDEARAIVDHDGSLHRVVGIVRVAGN
jgi:integral membrane sensor domain MASE1